MKNSKVRNMVLMAILGAWALLFRQLDVPLLPAAPFLKMDFSDLAVLVGLLVNGPVGMITVALIRDVLNYIMGGGQMGVPIGALMSITASIAMFMPTHLVLKYMKGQSKWVKYFALTVGSVALLTLAMSVINYYIALPWYVAVLEFPIDNYFAYVISIVVPFNLIKGVLYAIMQIATIEFVVPMIKRRGQLYPAYIQVEQPAKPANQVEFSQSH